MVVINVKIIIKITVNIMIIIVIVIEIVIMAFSKDRHTKDWYHACGVPSILGIVLFSQSEVSTLFDMVRVWWRVRTLSESLDNPYTLVLCWLALLFFDWLMNWRTVRFWPHCLRSSFILYYRPPSRLFSRLLYVLVHDRFDSLIIAMGARVWQ